MRTPRRQLMKWTAETLIRIGSAGGEARHKTSLILGGRSQSHNRTFRYRVKTREENMEPIRSSCSRIFRRLASRSAAAALLLAAGCGAPTSPSSDAGADFHWWQKERAHRQEQLSAYLETH